MTDLVEIAQDLKEIRALLSGIVDRHISRKEFAERLGVSAATLDRRVKAKTVPLPVDGRRLLQGRAARGAGMGRGA
jgi:transcriptional regulator with XRE-family HTH domain